jgi:prepilin peptidase CpaA
MSTSIWFLVFPAAMIFAAAMDMLTMTIPNRISIALAILFVPAAIAADFSLAQFGLHVAAGAVMLAAGIGMFSAGWVGGGDAKMLAGAALWLGFPQLAPLLLLTGAIGSLLMLAIVVYRTYPAGALPIPDWAARLHRSETGLPYGIAIGSAGVILFPYSSIFRALC